MPVEHPRPARTQPSGARLLDKPSPWVDLALTLPVFLVYQIGVPFLHVRNGTDLVTQPLLQLAEGDKALYIIVTIAIGAVFAGVFALLGRGRAFRPSKFAQVVVEGVVYAVAMRFAAAWIVQKLPIAGAVGDDLGESVVLSCGAGFYEELAFRVLLFGLGAKALVWLFAREKVGVVAASQAKLGLRAVGILVVWGFVVAGVFSGVHYVGELAYEFKIDTFVFRMILGLALTLIYATRGFATAVWAHALYDVWVMTESK